MDLKEPGLAREVFAPYTYDEVFERYFERAPLHIARDDPAYFTHVYDVAELENSLVQGAREPDKFAAVKAGCEQPQSDALTVPRPAVRWRFTGQSATHPLDPRRLVNAYEQGYTVVVKDAGMFSARLQRFCNALQADLGQYVQANVYLTPPAAQGFEVHHDTHDTLTVQIEGIKTWRLYEPVIELPLESTPFHSGTKVPGLKLHGEVTLRPGDTLYLPRGFPHEATTTTGRSLHVTFALVPMRVTDLLEDVLRIASDNDVELRRALPRGWHRDPAFAAGLAATIGPRLLAALEPERVRAACDRALRELFGITRADVQGAFDDVARLAQLSKDTTVAFKRDVPFVLHETPTSIDLVIAGKSLAFPKLCDPALRRLERGEARVAELDALLTPANRTVLLRTLVLEGLLAISP